jgi:hypothetical protein
MLPLYWLCEASTIQPDLSQMADILRGIVENYVERHLSRIVFK